jgi:hypothetical protein
MVTPAAEGGRTWGDRPGEGEFTVPALRGA